MSANGCRDLFLSVGNVLEIEVGLHNSVNVPNVT